MIGRALGCAVNVALYVVVASILAIALGLLFGQLQLRSTPRGGPDAGGHETSVQALPGAPKDPDVAQLAEPSAPLWHGEVAGSSPAVGVQFGAPSPTASWGLGTPRRHSTGLAAAIRQPGATPRPSPRPAVAPSAARAGTAASYRPLPSDCRLPCYGVARTGPASWYNDGPGFYAAIPGYVDGTVVSVVVCTFPGGQANCGTFPVVDVCGCYRHTAAEKVVDLSPSAFALFAPLSAGIVKVQVTVLR